MVITEYQKSVIKQVDLIGDIITQIEQLCRGIEKLNPVLMNEIGEIYHNQSILKFIIDHRKYTIWYNEMSNFLFQELTNGAYIISQEELEAMANI